MLVVGRCIYCGYWKPVEAFNTEHVVHKAFGTFGSETPVLKCVCSHCNKTLGDEVDRRFTRDGVEALERVKAGLKRPADYKTEGKRSTLYLEFDKESPFRGSRGYHVPDSSGSGLAVTPLPQVGFARTETETPEWFSLDQLPTKEELRARGFNAGTPAFVEMQGVATDEALEALRAKGFTDATLTSENEPPTGRVKAALVVKISEPAFRAASKIAFNYLTYLAGPYVTGLPQFDSIRRFIRYGEKPPWEPVRPASNQLAILGRDTGAPLSGHYVVVRGDRNAIDGYVCLFTRICYRVRLAAGGFPGRVSAGHIFDLGGRRAWALSVDELPRLDPLDG